MNILKKVPHSILWILAYPDLAIKNLEKEAFRYGINFHERVIVTPTAPKDEHIARCRLADLVLDNPVVNGHTVSCDLLWSGVPLITMVGTQQMPSRVCKSLCFAIDCPEMVVTDLSFEAYE